MFGIRDRLWRAIRQVDEHRIREHLRHTEERLRQTDTTHLTAEQQTNRDQLLDRLHTYWQDRQFPTNDETDTRTPCFIGGNDVPCAMAYLMLEDGQDDLVETIAETDNTILIEDLDDGPALDWIQDQGLTQQEAARIQPSYDHLGGTTETITLAQSCGPLECSTAMLGAHLLAVTLFFILEYIGYRSLDQLFDENVLKHKPTLGYITLCNLALAPLIAYLVYALLP